MVFSDTEEFQPDLIGKNGLRDDLAQCFRMREGLSGRVEGDIAEGVESEFNRVRHPPSVPCHYGSVTFHARFAPAHLHKTFIRHFVSA